MKRPQYLHFKFVGMSIPDVLFISRTISHILCRFITISQDALEAKLFKILLDTAILPNAARNVTSENEIPYGLPSQQ